MPEHTSIAVEYASAVAHPARFRLVAALADGPRTVASLGSELETDEPTIRQHVDALHELGIVESESHPDGTMTYELLKAPVIWDTAWGQLPFAARRATAASAVTHISARATAAVDRGGFDREDIHLTRTTMQVDEEGWKTLTKVLSRALHEVGDVAERPAPAGETFSATAAIMLFTGERTAAEPPPVARRNHDDAVATVWELTEELADLPLEPDVDWDRVEALAEQVRLIARGMQRPPSVPVVQLGPE
ncbi:MAG TPA: winged helix-turn-helix domain-containing protein [Solirubrobacteraceae bacterium]|nr:winged helix-turn-helix domain-containing protein [Solirubrobacteraceae bacterium]